MTRRVILLCHMTTLADDYEEHVYTFPEAERDAWLARLQRFYPAAPREWAPGDCQVTVLGNAFLGAMPDARLLNWHCLPADIAIDKPRLPALALDDKLHIYRFRECLTALMSAALGLTPPVTVDWTPFATRPVPVAWLPYVVHALTGRGRVYVSSVYYAPSISSVYLRCDSAPRGTGVPPERSVVVCFSPTGGASLGSGPSLDLDEGFDANDAPPPEMQEDFNAWVAHGRDAAAPLLRLRAPFDVVHWPQGRPIRQVEMPVTATVIHDTPPVSFSSLDMTSNKRPRLEEEEEESSVSESAAKRARLAVFDYSQGKWRLYHGMSEEHDMDSYTAFNTESTPDADAIHACLGEAFERNADHSLRIVQQNTLLDYFVEGKRPEVPPLDAKPSVVRRYKERMAVLDAPAVQAITNRGEWRVVTADELAGDIACISYTRYDTWE
jgi:hypothetical protein